MFCPDGYYPFDEVWDFCNDLAVQLWIPRRVLDGEPPSGEAAMEHFIERELLCWWLIARALTTYRVHLCSPSGQLVVAAGPLLFHEDRLSRYDWAWSPPRHPAMAQVLERGVEINDSSPFHQRFRFIDVATGTICVARREDKIREFASAHGEEVEQQLFVASHFDGWALCFKSGHFPSDAKEFLAAIGIEDLRAVVATPVPDSPEGRPGLRKLASSAYRSAYPYGHNGVSWKVVESEVAARAGRPISAKTIKRSLGQSLD